MRYRILTMNVSAMYLFRKQKGLSLRGLSKKTSISTSNLCRIERGESIPRLNTAAKIASALGKNVTDLWELKL